MLRGHLILNLVQLRFERSTSARRVSTLALYTHTWRCLIPNLHTGMYSLYQRFLSRSQVRRHLLVPSIRGQNNRKTNDTVVSVGFPTRCLPRSQVPSAIRSPRGDSQAFQHLQVRRLGPKTPYDQSKHLVRGRDEDSSNLLSRHQPRPLVNICRRRRRRRQTSATRHRDSLCIICLRKYPVRVHIYDQDTIFGYEIFERTTVIHHLNNHLCYTTEQNMQGVSRMNFNEIDRHFR